MQLLYTSPEEITIKVTLDEGESLGNLAGPIEAHVPCDPDNVDYAAILDEELPVDPYVTPTPSPEAAIADSAQSLELSNAKSLAAQGRTDEAIAALITLMEKQS
jgi:hypothetical protein